MFTVAERDRMLVALQELARSDKRLAAGALIGSTASGGDRWSDLDLTFGIIDSVGILEVMTDWTKRLHDEFRAVNLLDLSASSTIYRVFLFPGNLQVDLSFTPRAEFGALGPNFKLFFGSDVKRPLPPAPTPGHLFGFAVLCLLKARINIERKRFWEAEYLISYARDQILTLACLHRGLKTNYGKGFDDLPLEILNRFNGTFVRSPTRSQLLQALRRTVDGLLANTQNVEGLASEVETNLRELQSETIV